MTNPFQPDRIPEPRWLRFGPDDPDEPPDNYLPDEQRRTLTGIVEWLEGDLMEIKAQFDSGTAEVDSSLRKDADKAYEEWKEATQKLQQEIEILWDETVGDDWNEPDF